MASDERLASERFPRSSKYHPEWVLAGRQRRGQPPVADRVAGRGARPAARHAGAGPRLRAGAVVDLPAPRVRRAGLGHRPVVQRLGEPPAHPGRRRRGRRLPDPRRRPVAAVRRGVLRRRSCRIDSFFYYGTDDLYLNYLARFVKPGGPVGIAGAGLMQEIDGPVPEHLREWWAQDLPWCLHSAAWWRRHWERTGILDVEVADTLPDGWRFWLDWQQAGRPGQRGGDRGAGGRSAAVTSATSGPSAAAGRTARL